MPVDVTEPVNLTRSIFVCNIFSFLFAASKSCLLPFLTLYLRMLGLTATETGMVIGAKTFSAFIFAPLWSKCATSCKKRKFVLVFSLFMMAATYLSLTLIPSVNHDIDSCRSSSINLPADLLQPSDNVSYITTAATNLTKTLPPAIKLQTTVSTSNTQKSSRKVADSARNLTTTTTTTEVTTTESARDAYLLRKIKEIVEKFDSDIDVKDLNVEQMRELLRKELKLVKDNGYEYWIPKLLTKEEIGILEEFLHGDKSSHTRWRGRRDLGQFMTDMHDKVLSKFNNFKEKIKDAKRLAFTVVMVVLILGEMLCSPVEKIADDSWFEFLEHIDDMEKYGKHRIWSSVAYILFPIIVTLIVDHTECLFNMSIHPFMLHFYTFGGFLGLAFLVAFFYPIPPSEKSIYKSKLTKALSLTCCRLGGLLYIVTLLIMGLIFSSFSNFLFWLIQDKGGSEVIMGMCILIASLAELPMLFLGGQLVKRLGNGGVVSIALLGLSVRTLYYSFLPTPWAVIPAELTHAFTHTAMWFAVLSHRAFQVTPSIDRSIRSVLSSVYFGVGFGAGSMISGILYDHYGLNILFRACSILSIGWCPIFFIMNRCCHPVPEKDIKYTRLLQSEDQTDDEDDDWLEHAMKD